MRSLYSQLAENIRRQILDGDIVPGQKLPPIRTMADDLGLNRDTVAQAYDLLAREGLVRGAVGRGTFVMAPPRPPAPQTDLQFAGAVERLSNLARTRPDYGEQAGAIPLHALLPDPALYPVAAFRRSLNRVLEDAGPDVLAYGDHQGSERLRALMVRRLAGHGIHVSDRHVVLCQGASQGISLALRVFADPGDTIAVEEPAYHNVLSAIAGNGLRAAAVAMTPDGPDLEALDRLLARRDVKLFYTMPSFHNPMGTTTSLAHRRALVEIAERHGKPIIEDAFEMDLRYEGRPLPPLASLDTVGLVIHLFSFSKSLFPGVRVGAITARGRTVRALLALKQATDLSGALLLQEAVAEFVESGAYDRHLLAFRRTLKSRRDALLGALEAGMPPASNWTHPLGGCQIWLELPSPIDTRTLFDEAKRAGVLYAPGDQFLLDGRASSGLRLTFALAPEADIARGVEILGRSVRAHRPTRRSGPRRVAVHA